MKGLLLILACLVALASAHGCLRRGFTSADPNEGPPVFAGPRACRGNVPVQDRNTSSCCFFSLQDSIDVDFETCPYDIIYLESGVFEHYCAAYNVSREFSFVAFDPAAKPTILAPFDVQLKSRPATLSSSLSNRGIKPHLLPPTLNSMNFTNLIWSSPRAVRMRSLNVKHVKFEGCEFIQTAADVMLKLEMLTLQGELIFKDCYFYSYPDTLSYSTSWASFTFEPQRIPGTSLWQGRFWMDNVTFNASRSDDGSFQLMEIDVDGARNFALTNSHFMGGATLYLSDSLEVVINNTTFRDTGITSTTSSNVTIENCDFSEIRVLDRARSPFARSIHFKDASQPNQGTRGVNIINNRFRSFVPEPKISNAAISFSASPARIYFDSVLITRNQFSNMSEIGLYAIMDEDFGLQIQAPLNWWGSRTGPLDGCNRNARGARIFWDPTTLRTNVDYRPWCADKTCTSALTNRKNCPWPAYIYAVIALSSGLALGLIVVGVLLVRHWYLARQYTKLTSEVEEEYHSRLLRRVKNLDELLARYNVRRVFMNQLDIGDRIGEGTFGYVHKAFYRPTKEFFGFVDMDTNSHDSEKERLVAVKYIKNRWLQAYDSFGNFLEEVKVMSMVEHPHVQSLIGIALDLDENICMVSEFMALGSLTSVMDSPDLTLVRKLDISLDTAYGMAHLHSKGMRVVHRDLKPGNILISGDWVARVADFGTSIATARDSSVASAVGTTPVYLSPEAALYNEFSEKSDVFAYGITLYELWAQEISYPTLTDGGLSVIQEYAKKRSAPDLPRLPRLPPKISELIKKCVAFDTDERPTFDEILTFLVSSRGSIRSPSQQSASASRSSSQPSSPMPLISIDSDDGMELDSISGSAPSIN